MERRHDLDWLRDITVLSIIFFHSLIIFFTRESAVMYVRAGVDLRFCIYMESIMSRYMMPLLFILAGFSLSKSLEKRTMKEILKSRVSKLLVPFILFSITLNPITSYVYGLTQGRTMSLATHWIKFITSVSKDFEARTTGYGPMHLWFILFLFVYTLVCLPIFKRLKSEKCEKGLAKIASFFSKPYRLFLLTFPYFALFIIDIMDEMNPIAYLYLFVLGFILASNDSYQMALDRDKWGYLILSIITVAISLYSWYAHTGNDTWVMFYSKKAARLLIPMAMMGLGHSFIPNKSTKVLQYFNQANYPIYLYHMSVLTIVGYFVLEINTSSVVQFLIINIISYAICFGIFEIYRRVRSVLKKQKI